MQRRGFSRIELLLVVAVVGVVTALLLPVLAQSLDEARDPESARRTQCMANLKNIVNIMRMYSGDYDGKYPLAAISGEDYGWVVILEPYLESYGQEIGLEPFLGSREVFQCPSEKHPRRDNPRLPGYTDYWYNRNLAGVSDVTIKDPASTLVFGDGDGGYVASDARYAINYLPKSWLRLKGTPIRRHLGGGNYAFVDGHVKWYESHFVEDGRPPNPTFKIK